jgi:hypothetical protein
MFKARRQLVRERVMLPKAAALVTALSVTTLGCALEPRAGDGLDNSDWRDVQINPATTTGTPSRLGDKTIEQCAHLDLFTQLVFPLFTTKHEGIPQPDVPYEGPQACSDCHDGTKLKAIVAMFVDPLKPGDTCISSLGREITKHDILSSSNPARTDVVHDFKFKNPDDYNRFHEAVVMWLTAEGVTPTP